MTTSVQSHEGIWRRVFCFLWRHDPADIGCARIATGKRVWMCMRCGTIEDEQ